MKNAVKLNAYEVLGIPEGASKITVKNAWIKKLKEIHPDVNKDANAENQTRKINAAYAAIKSGQNTFLFSGETKSQDELKIKKQNSINIIENFDCLQKIEKEAYINKINQVHTPIEVEVELEKARKLNEERKKIRLLAITLIIFDCKHLSESDKEKYIDRIYNSFLIGEILAIKQEAQRLNRICEMSPDILDYIEKSEMKNQDIPDIILDGFEGKGTETDPNIKK